MKKRLSVFLRLITHTYSRSTLTIGLLFLIGITLGMKNLHNKNEAYISLPSKQEQDIEASKEAFIKVYSVLMHPRCVNCHPIGDVPLQGDDSHIHNMLPQRGEDGKGVSTMKCATCHAATGVPGENTPPGNPSWHLPPADMKMTFQGRSARELALQLVDPEKNGHKNMKDLREHAEDTLVKAGWNMGGERELPPLSYEEFKEVWYTWIDNGAHAPSD